MKGWGWMVWIGVVCAWVQPVQALDSADLGLAPSYLQGAIIRGQLPSEFTALTYSRRLLRLDANRRFVLGVGRDTSGPITLMVEDTAGQQHPLSLTITKRDYAIQRVNGVPERTVSPAPEALERIRRESLMTQQARDVDSDLSDFAASFTWPLTGPITGVYGSQRVYNGVPKNPHFGVDVARPKGALVVAPAGGVVRLVHDDMYFSGGTLIVDHGHGLTSTFIHLSEILVEPGQRLAQGEPIAKVGATGRATGPHLDWRMNWFTERVDPQTLVGPMPGH